MRARSGSGYVLLLAVFVLGTCSAAGGVKLAGAFGDHMVLQRDAPVHVWGWADAGESVTVRFSGQTKTAKAGADGAWRLVLDPVPAGGPHELGVSGTDTLTVSDVLVGEVWLCSGQSNMAMGVGGARNADEEAKAANFPRLRMVTIKRRAAKEAQRDCEHSGWKLCQPATVKGFSATAYYFGRELHRHLQVPVGLINASWGGTCVEAWQSCAALESLESGRTLMAEWAEKAASYDPDAARGRYEKQLQAWQAKRKAGKRQRKPRAPVHPDVNQNAPGRLYNGMIAPLVPYAIRGAIWYQGERNSNDLLSAYEYRDELPNLIRSWREVWRQGEFPFLFVQLPNFGGKAPDALALNRESMLLALQNTSNTGMAITVDIGETKDIHPKNKQDVGKRLALIARHVAYGEELAFSGPIFRGATFGDGNAVVDLDHAGGGLASSDGEELREFMVAGADRQFVPATAEIRGDQIVVSSKDVPAPVAVRYAWTNDPTCNLINRERLPASPFRSDTWPIGETETE